jgi:hypothetical protein
LNIAATCRARGGRAAVQAFFSKADLLARHLVRGEKRRTTEGDS